MRGGMMKMKKIPKETKHITELPICWIKKGEQYRLHTQTKGNNLPIIRISPKIERTLQKFEAGYRKVKMAQGDMYEFWDENFFETEQLTLPTYTFLFGEYKLIGNNTFENPTRETLEKAFELESRIKEYLKSEENTIQVYEGEMEEILATILDGRPSGYIFSESFEEDAEYETENEHFFVFVLKTYTGELTGHVLLFNLKKINSKVNVEVPKEYVAYICGRQGCNLKKWCKKMGIKKINLQTLKEENR